MALLNVERKMKKILNNKFVVGTILLCIWIYSFAKWILPYNRAKLAIAYKLYMDTTMYKEREAGFGKEFAFNSFVENGEHRFFLRKLTFFDKLKAAVIPFNYIGMEEE